MDAVRITKYNVHTIMLNAGIDSGMLMKSSDAECCSMSAYRCRDACNKYGLSSDDRLVGKERGGACVLYRLYNIVNNTYEYDILYAPEHLAVEPEVGEL